MKSCPRCGSTYPDTEQFCESDGTCAGSAESGAGNRARWSCLMAISPPRRLSVPNVRARPSRAKRSVIFAARSCSPPRLRPVAIARRLLLPVPSRQLRPLPRPRISFPHKIASAPVVRGRAGLRCAASRKLRSVNASRADSAMRSQQLSQSLRERWFALHLQCPSNHASAASRRRVPRAQCAHRHARA